MLLGISIKINCFIILRGANLDSLKCLQVFWSYKFIVVSSQPPSHVLGINYYIIYKYFDGCAVQLLPSSNNLVTKSTGAGNVQVGMDDTWINSNTYCDALKYHWVQMNRLMDAWYYCIKYLLGSWYLLVTSERNLR